MFRKEVKYWSLIILLSYAPVIIIELLERILWYHTTMYPEYIIGIDAIFTVGFFPLYLTWINYINAEKYNKDSFSFIINCFIIISCILMAFTMCQDSYADSRGVVDDPEDFAFLPNIIEGMVALGVTIFWIIGFFAAFVSYRHEIKLQKKTVAITGGENIGSSEPKTINNLKYWSLIILLSYGIVIISHLLAGILWRYDKDNSGVPPLVEGILGILILPTYLVRMNYAFAQKYDKSKWSFRINSLIIISCALLSGYMNLQHCVAIMQPGDYDITFRIIEVETVITMAISLVGIVGSYNKLPNGH